MQASIVSWVNELSQHEQRSRGLSLIPSFAALPLGGALWAVLFGATLIVTISGTASAQVFVNKSTMKPDVGWATTWGSAQLQPYGTEVLPAGTLDGSTLRQVVHLSAGGTRLRLRLSNASWGSGCAATAPPNHRRRRIISRPDWRRICFAWYI